MKCFKKVKDMTKSIGLALEDLPVPCLHVSRLTFLRLRLSQITSKV